jgi:hypothetical protein
MHDRLDILFAPVLPAWAVAAFAVLAVVLAVALWLVRRNTAAALARLAAAGVLLAALAGPQLQKEKRQPLDGVVVIVKDRSLSQHVDGRLKRAEAAAGVLARRLRALGGLDVREFTLAERDGRAGTRLVSALQEALADVPPERFAGAFLITDGRVHDMPERPAAALPPGYEGPVHVLIDGRRNERDRRVVIEQAARYGIVGKEHEVRFRVEQTGGDANQPVAVRIRVNGKDWGSHRVLPGRSIRLQLPVAHAGQNIAEISAAPMEGGELSLRNNHAVVITRGVRDRLKVLLISGEPHPGERTWRNLLKADPSVDLVHFTILRPPEKQDGTPIRELALIAFPTRELFVEKLDSFDLIIFDRYQRRAILPEVYMANVAEYVRNGGAVLVTAGPEFASEFSLYLSPLSEVMPVEPRMRQIIARPFRAEVSGLGRRHPVTRGLQGAGTVKGRPSWGRWFRIIEAAPAGDAQVLMTGPDARPLLVLARRGEGRIAALMSDHIWLWARKYDGGGPHVELLRRLAHWLMKEPDLEEEALEGTVEGTDLVITRRTMGEKVPPLEVTLPDGSRRTLNLQRQAPGVFVARLRDAPVGLYRLRNGDLERLAAVGELDSLEMRAITATDTVLAPLAAATGGGVVWISAGEGRTEGQAAAAVRVPRIVAMPSGRAMHGGGWLGVRRPEAYRLLAIERVPLFGAMPALVVALLLLGLAWRLESR